MNWDTRRKLIYALTVIVVLSATGVFLLRNVLFPEPTCVDGKKNGFELGIDCGGVCSLRCEQEVSPLSVVWAKAVPSDKGVYDLVALVQNKNIDNASRKIDYTFTIYDGKGLVIGTLSGETVAPLDGKFPLIIQNVPLKTPPVNVVASISDGPHYRVTESPTSPTVKVTNERYEGGDTPRVYATVVNTKHVEIYKLPVRLILFDGRDNVYAVGQTEVPVLQKTGTKDVVFTWNQPFPFPPTRIEAYPIFSPFDAIDY